jgi:hypothetical protein
MNSFFFNYILFSRIDFYLFITKLVPSFLRFLGLNEILFGRNVGFPIKTFLFTEIKNNMYIIRTHPTNYQKYNKKNQKKSC